MGNKIMSSIIMLLVIGLMSAFTLADNTSPQSLIVTLINQNPSPAVAGNTADLTFAIENSGSSNAQNVVLELLPSYPFTLADTNSVQNLNTIFAYQTGPNHAIADFKVKVDKDASSGTYDLTLRYKYGASDWITKTINVQVTGQEYAQILIDKSKLDPGKETNITFKITNVGTAPLKNLLFSWTEPTNVILPVYSDNSKYVSYLDAGATVDLTYTVIADVNANPGLYPITLNMNFESVSTSGSTNTTENSVQTKSGLFIGGETDFDVAFSQSSAGQTSLSVSNVGNTPALSVSVRVPQQPNYRVSGSDTSIIGNLDKGDYTLVSFQIVSVSSMNGTPNRTFSGVSGQRVNQSGAFQGYMRGNLTRTGTDNGLIVLIDYTDTAGERRTVEKVVSIQFRDTTSSGFSGTGRTATTKTSFIGSTWFYVFIVVVIIAGIIVYRKRKSIFKNAKK